MADLDRDLCSPSSCAGKNKDPLVPMVQGGDEGLGDRKSQKHAHINNKTLLNGCLKHSLEENGRVKIIENSDTDLRTLEGGEATRGGISPLSDQSDNSLHSLSGGVQCGKAQTDMTNSEKDISALSRGTGDLDGESEEKVATTPLSDHSDEKSPQISENQELPSPEYDSEKLIDISCQTDMSLGLDNVEFVVKSTKENQNSEQNGEGSDISPPVDSNVKSCIEGISNLKLEGEEEGISKNNGEKGNEKVGDLEYVVYESELQMPDIMRLITKDLSEPYSIYTYRYFIHNWPRLCFLAKDGEKCVGAIVCKHDLHKKMVRRGYIAMLAIDRNYRRRGIGSHLVMKAIRAMVADECDEVVLETEITNKAALKLYENLGFLRDKRLFRYYLNGVDALRLKLWLR